MRTTFSAKEMEELKNHPCVYDCTAKSVYYTHEFKKRAVDLQASGIHPKEIWKQAGFNTDLWKKGYFGFTLRDWKKIIKKDGIEGLQKMDGLPYDRGPKQTRDDEMYIPVRVYRVKRKPSQTSREGLNDIFYLFLYPSRTTKGPKDKYLMTFSLNMAIATSNLSN